jgi:hypothetical protein
MSAHPGDLTPDRAQLAEFMSRLFRNASPEGFIALRSFVEGSKDQGAILAEWIRIGDPDFLDTVYERARQAATWNKPAVFCRRRDVRTHGNAKTENPHEGVALSVECDQRPLEARQTRSACKTTAVVASGGEWTTQIEPKWFALAAEQPTSTKAEHDFSRGAQLATELAGGDGITFPLFTRSAGKLARKVRYGLCKSWFPPTTKST